MSDFFGNFFSFFGAFILFAVVSYFAFSINVFVGIIAVIALWYLVFNRKSE